MGGQKLSDLIDPAHGLDFADWLDRLEDIALDHGDFEPLGPDHSALLIEDGPALLVTFEVVDTVRSRTDVDVPLGWELKADQNWSQLCVLGHGPTWFRHRAIYQYFDRLVDEGFFDNFDRVVFFGAGACGYAAAAYSVAAPGSTVLLARPQATLDPEIAGWDTRFPKARRLDFTSRYGYAPQMVEAAERVFVFHDPEVSQDAMHASLFRGGNVVQVRTPHLMGQVEGFLRRMKILNGLVTLALKGRLTPRIVYRAMRERRNYLPYLRRLLGRIEEADRPYLAGLMCRAALKHFNAPRFRRQLAEAEKRLARDGRKLPAERMAESA